MNTKLTLYPLLIATILLAACSNEPPDRSRQFDSKRDYGAETQTATTISAEAAEFAYGKVKFGITEKQYNKLMPEIRQTVGQYDYMFLPQFDESGKLFGIYIQGYKETANYIDNKLTDQMMNLKNVIEEKYGSSTTNNGAPEFFQFRPGQVQWQFSWVLNTKRIQLGLSEEDSGSEYRAVGYIYDQNMMDEYNEHLNSKVDKNKRSSSNNF